MKRYRGSDWARAGFYWNPTGWEIVAVQKHGGCLPGEPVLRYIRLPIFVVLPLGLILGAFYVIFLPLAGFVMFSGFVGKNRLGALQKGLASARRGVRPLHNEND